MSSDASDEFQKELVDLFIQEAHEWLQNIHVALDELQQGPPPERHASLIHTLTAGVTNLGGSAATINLPDVEQASFAALPFIEAIADPKTTCSVNDFLLLCKQLGQIHTALTNATGVSFEKEGSETTVEAVEASFSPSEFLQLLRGLQLSSELTASTGRDLIRTMIEQMEGQVHAGVQQLGVDVVRGYLERMAESEDAFIKIVDDHVLSLTARLKQLADAGSPPSVILESAIQEVAKLRAEAQEVNAGLALAFFGGLQSLLSIVLQHRVRLASAKIDAITSRLGTITQLVRQWVERGNAERTAINQALPVH